MILNKKTRGFTIIEVIISSAIVAVLLLSFLTLMVHSIIVSQKNLYTFRAEMYLRELIEATRDLELSGATSDWNALTACTSACHPEIVSNAWTLNLGTLSGDEFTRWITVEPVMRDSLAFPNSIVQSGVDDPNTKKIKASVSWTDREKTQTLLMETYVYNYND